MIVGMASACVNKIGMSPENFLDCPPGKYPSYGWLSPRISFSREFPEEDTSKPVAVANKPIQKAALENNADEEEEKKTKNSDLEISASDFSDFEFRLEDPAVMLPADELFFDGKLVPLQLSTIRESMATGPTFDGNLPDTPIFARGNHDISAMDPYLFSPKAPRCSSRWKELLGLKKHYQNQNSNVKQEDQKITTTSNRNASRSLKHFLHRSSKSSSADSSLSLPLLKDLDSESVSISSRLSLSSSSSGHEYDDLPRLSLDSDKPNTAVTRNAHQSTTSNLSRVRLVKHRTVLPSENPTAAAGTAGQVSRSPMRRGGGVSTENIVHVRGVSADSPRMNSSGKVVFNSLERSSSSPSSFNGGPRYKYRGMERSYSANVRITPVLNVPVCSLRGSSKSGVFGLFSSSSSQQKKENNGGGGLGSNRSQQNNNKNRTDHRT